MRLGIRELKVFTNLPIPNPTGRSVSQPVGGRTEHMDSDNTH